MDAAECIGCGACVAACPNGSAMLFTSAKINHLNILPQGQPEKNSRVLNMVEKMDEEGFGACTNHAECQDACPKGISIKFISIDEQAIPQGGPLRSHQESRTAAIPVAASGSCSVLQTGCYHVGLFGSENQGPPGMENPMSRSDIPLPQQRRFGQTSRTDRWWLIPLAGVPGPWRIRGLLDMGRLPGPSTTSTTCQGAHYLSPFYSPLIYGQAGEPTRGSASSKPAWLSPGGQYPRRTPDSLGAGRLPIHLLLLPRRLLQVLLGRSGRPVPWASPARAIAVSSRCH